MIYFVDSAESVTSKPLESNSDIYEKASINDVFNYFKGHKEIQVDTETTGFDVYTTDVMTLQLGDYDNQFVIDCRTVPLFTFKSILEKKDCIYFFQNAKFDLRFFLKANINIPRVYDTFLVEKIITNGIKYEEATQEDVNNQLKGIFKDELTGKWLKPYLRNLEALTKRYCNSNAVNKEIRGQIHYRGLDDTVIDYAANDVKWLQKIRDGQMKIVNTLELNKAVDLDHAYVRVLAYTEYNGFHLDKEMWLKKCEEDEENFKKSLDALDQYIFDNNMYEFIDNQLDMFSEEKRTKINWSSSQQVVKFFKKLGVNTTVVEKGEKKESVDAKVIAPQKHKSSFIPLYLNYKGLEKTVSTYGRNFIKQINPVSGRLHTTFTQLMETGRLSSGGKDRTTGQQNLNFQNIPAGSTRDCFTAEPGNTLVVADYSGQEQIMLANHSQDDDLIHFYSQNLGDMHSFVASKIYPELGTDLNYIKDNHKDKRQIAKAAGFAINYGGNGFTIANNLSIPAAEGENVYKAYFEAFPGLKNYFDKVQGETWKNGFITYNDVTKRKFIYDYNGKFEYLEKIIKQPGFWETYRQAKANNTQEYIDTLGPLVKSYFRSKSEVDRKSLNYPIQGSSADVTKIAGILFFKWIENNKLMNIVKIPNFVHDEIVVECPERMAEEVAQKLKESMEQAGTYFCKTIPLKATPVISNKWEH
jgi:DNA polymerase I-like protein with 3'-5' exonuclease and polymerase domains